LKAIKRPNDSSLDVFRQSQQSCVASLFFTVHPYQNNPPSSMLLPCLSALSSPPPNLFGNHPPCYPLRLDDLYNTLLHPGPTCLGLSCPAFSFIHRHAAHWYGRWACLRMLARLLLSRAETTSLLVPYYLIRLVLLFCIFIIRVSSISSYLHAATHCAWPPASR
jgi:hypothetical protein